MRRFRLNFTPHADADELRQEAIAAHQQTAEDLQALRTENQKWNQTPADRSDLPEAVSRLTAAVADRLTTQKQRQQTALRKLVQWRRKLTKLNRRLTAVRWLRRTLNFCTGLVTVPVRFGWRAVSLIFPSIQGDTKVDSSDDRG